MAWLTPRRRLLATAPLAIILPAGLLSFLGLKTIRILDDGFSAVTAHLIPRQMETIQYTLEREILQCEEDFLAAMHNLSLESPPTSPLENIQVVDRFILDDELPFAAAILCMREHGELHVYRRAKPPDSDTQADAPPTAWPWERDPLDTLAQNAGLNDYLNRQIDERRSLPKDQVLALGTADPVPLVDNRWPDWGRRLDLRYTTATSPDDRTEFGFKILSTDGSDRSHMILAGLIFDRNWVVNNVERIINLDFVMRPISVIDDDGQVVATTADSVSLDDELYARDVAISEEAFYGWSIRFPAKPHEEFLTTYERTRSVIIPLIITAIVIMVLAVLGAVRNLASELTLAELRSAFVAKVSHELRTPLGLIRLFSETLEMGRYKDEEQGRDYLHTITKESERLTRLIDNVLDFSQIEAGQKAYQLRPDSISDTVKTVADLLRFHAERHGLTLDVHVEAGLPMISFDRAALEQAIWNLVANAIKYSGDGTMIEVLARRGDGEVVVEVRDQGIGIQSTERDKIFKQFFRVDDPRVQEKGGSGLGLTVVKHIVEGHGGHVTLESRLGQGSTFGLHFPLEPLAAGGKA